MSNIKIFFSTATGFTLIELMIVIVILGILASIAIPNFIGITEDTRVKVVKSELKSIQTVLEMYATENGNYPVASSATIMDSVSGLDISDDGLKGPNKEDYYYKSSVNGMKYAMWYTYIDKNKKNARIMITSEAGVTSSTSDSAFATTSTPSGISF